jgi:hypothetical protein
MFIEYRTNVQVPYSTKVTAEDCVTEIQGDIMTFIGDAEDATKLGELYVDYLDVQRAKIAGIPIWTLFDYASDMGVRFYEDAWNEDLNTYHTEVTEALGGENALLIGGIYIEPEYRGHKLALAAIELSIQHFGHACGVVGIKPYPQIQKIPPELSAAEIQSSIVSLSTYFARLGFRPVPDSPLMALDLDRVRPTLAEVGWQGSPD